MDFPTLYQFVNKEFDSDKPYSNCKLIRPIISSKDGGKTQYHVNIISQEAQILERVKNVITLIVEKTAILVDERFCIPPTLEGGGYTDWKRYQNGLPNESKDSPLYRMLLIILKNLLLIFNQNDLVKVAWIIKV